MRKQYLDYLRTIAIFSVITIHVTAFFYHRDQDVGSIGWWLANILNSLSRFAVPLFVMISGALLLRKPVKTGEFYRKKSFRLFPPIIFWTVFYIILKLFQGDTVQDVLWFIKVSLFVEGQSAVHLWYLTMFVCLMAFAPFINKFVHGNKPTPLDFKLLLLVAFMFFILNQVAIIAEDVLNLSIVWFKSFPWFVAYFILGYYLDQFFDKKVIKNRFIILSLVCLFSIGIYLNYYLFITQNILRDSLILGSTGPLVFLISALVFILIRQNAAKLQESRIISSLSESSFGMYLIHPVIIYICVHTLPNYGLNPLLYIPFVTLVTIILSFLMIYFMRKIPIFRFVS